MAIKNTSLQPDLLVVTQLVTEHGFQVQRVIPIIGQGIINQVFVVETSSQPIVARLNRKERSIEPYLKEQWCLEQAGRVGIPVPHVLAVGTQGEFTYMLQTYIPGVSSASSGIDPLDVLETLGEYAARANMIPVQGYGGKMDLTRPGMFTATWQAMVDVELNDVFRDDYWSASGAFSPQHVDTLQKMLQPIYMIEGQAGICHTDIGPKNTILGGADNATVYLIDWEFAEAAPVPAYQLACVARYAGYHSKVMNAFVRGYNRINPQVHESEPDAKLLTVAAALRIVRWAQDNQPEEVEEYTRSAQFITHDLFGDILR